MQCRKNGCMGLRFKDKPFCLPCIKKHNREMTRNLLDDFDRNGGTVKKLKAGPKPATRKWGRLAGSGQCARGRMK